MDIAIPGASDETPAVARLSGWISDASAEPPENASFLSGSALAVLDLLAGDPAVPQALWRARLALDAATSTAHLEGRREGAALILADEALARGLGWDSVIPLLAVGLKPRDLARRADDLRLACHLALLLSAAPAARLAADLARRARRLRAVTPKLRAAGADRAVALFLSSDALAPATLTGFMSDRAARRLCDRLVELDALRELTGRDSFRLYGV